MDNILSVDFDIKIDCDFDINVDFELISVKVLILLGLRVILGLIWVKWDNVKSGILLDFSGVYRSGCRSGLGDF